jgi:hypothetical protein
MARNTKMADKVFNGMKGTILVKADRWAKMHEEAKEDKVVHDEVRQERKVEDADRAKLVSQGIKIQNFEQTRATDKAEIKELKKTNAALNAEVKAAKEMARLEKMKADATNRAGLLQLHKTLDARKAALQKTIEELKNRAALDREDRTTLIKAYNEAVKMEKGAFETVKTARDTAGRTKKLRAEYDQKVQEINSSSRTDWQKRSNLRAAAGKYYLDLMALSAFVERQRLIKNKTSADSLSKYFGELEKRRDAIIDDISRQSATKAHELISQQLDSDKQTIQSITDPAAMVATLTALRKKSAALKDDVTKLKASAPPYDRVIAGEYKAVSQTSSPDVAKRLLKRLDEQLTTIQNATVSKKVETENNLAKAMSTVYAHQIANSRDPKTLATKVQGLAKWTRKVRGEVSALRKGQNPRDSGSPPQSQIDTLARGLTGQGNTTTTTTAKVLTKLSKNLNLPLSNSPQGALTPETIADKAKIVKLKKELVVAKTGGAPVTKPKTAAKSRKSRKSRKSGVDEMPAGVRAAAEKAFEKAKTGKDPEMDSTTKAAAEEAFDKHVKGESPPGRGRRGGSGGGEEVVELSAHEVGSL